MNLADIKRVWKVASRWSEEGFKESSILDIFRRHNVVFVGKSQHIFNRIVTGDLVVISDGIKIVAMGIATTNPKPVTEMEILFSDSDKEYFDYLDTTLGCRVAYTDLKEFQLYCRKVCHEVISSYHKEKFKMIYSELQQRFEIEKQFEIDARSCTLRINEREKNNILLKNNISFRIPIYQRPYSWQENDVKKLLTDLRSAFWGIDGNVPREPLFIGTMQLSVGKSNDIEHNTMIHEIIDGQQRLSTLILLLKVLLDSKPEMGILKDLPLTDLLKTDVSNGIQQQHFIEALNTDTSKEFEIGQNHYLKIAKFIKEFLQEDEPSGESKDDELVNKPFDAEAFVKYLFSRVYFVVIETRAGLSKTLQIFEAINTTGMDLSGGDVFKVRFYEYLCRNKKIKEGEFKKVSDLYESIDTKNNDKKRFVCSIENILSLLQHTLIARHTLPKLLHDYAADTFFNRFFDVLIPINKWDHFTKAKEVEVDIDELETLIDLRFEWESRQSSFSAEAQCAIEFIKWSRYGKYAYLPILFLHRFGSDSSVEKFVVHLAKLLVLLSLWKRRSIYEGHDLMAELHTKLFDRSLNSAEEEIFRFLRDKATEKRDLVKHVLNNEIISDNSRAKNLACRISGMIDQLKTNMPGEEIRKLLFETEIDIEHIESANHKNGQRREDIHKQWGIELDQIGNLIILEMEINRSIRNEDYEEVKIPGYKNSKFQIVQNHLNSSLTWDLEKCKKRKEMESERVVKYLCGELES